MSLERRLSELEKLCGGSERPFVFLYTAGSDPPLTEAEEKRLIREAMERDPGRAMYMITVPRRKQDDSHR